MGGPNLEVFKFGMYIMFPIGIMYYFGVNLDEKFSVPDFWPKRGETHTIPFEREEITEELARLKARRLQARARRLELEGNNAQTEDPTSLAKPSPILQTLNHSADSTSSSSEAQREGSGSFSWLRR